MVVDELVSSDLSVEILMHELFLENSPGLELILFDCSALSLTEIAAVECSTISAIEATTFECSTSPELDWTASEFEVMLPELPRELEAPVLV